MPGTQEVLNKYERSCEFPSGTHTSTCVFLTILHRPSPLDLLATPEPTCRTEVLTGCGVWCEAGLGLNRGFDTHTQPGYK